METSTPGVYSAGDVAETIDMLLKEKRVTPIWPNAYRQGQLAGQNMAGARKSYEGSLPMNSIAFYGIPTVSMGITNPPAGGEYETLITVDEPRGMYRKCVMRAGCLVGAVLVGKIGRAGILTGMIKNRIPVSDFKDRLMKEEFGLTDFPREFREQLLASA
jgi:NAD(P)H-nitrite reductase large subunit